MQSFYNFTINGLKSYLTENGFKPYNADQLYKWVYEQKETNYHKMTNISRKLREFLLPYKHLVFG